MPRQLWQPLNGNEMSNDEYTEYEEVLSTHNAGDQAFIKSILEAEGITYYIQGEHVAPYLYHALPLRVMVKESEVAKAKEILRDVELAFTYGGGNGEEAFKESENEEGKA